MMRAPETMQLRRLSWAGVEIRRGRDRLLMDPLWDVLPLRSFLGEPKQALVPVSVDGHTWALVTHLHPDHCDRRLLARLDGRVLCNAPLAPVLEAEGVPVHPAELWQSRRVGAFRVTPVLSHDWRGDTQVAWVVETAGRRLIHCGDTIWHGGWYEVARRHGPFDVAFLPINGVIVQLEGFTPTSIPATLTPEQAIEAAAILGARAVCAIHHGLFDNPPRYVEQDSVIDRLYAAGRKRGIATVAPRDGEVVAIPSADTGGPLGSAER